MKATTSLRSRFVNCFEKSLAWLAVEIFREETDKIKTSKATQDRRHAQYHNFYGAHFLSYCEGFPIYFQLAKEEFLEATKLCPDWLQPYENLGDVYSIEAMDIKTPEAAFRHLERSISYYDIALKKKAMDISGKLSEDSTLNKQVEFRIKLDRNYADLLRWAEQVDELWKDIEAAEAEIRSKDRDQIVLLEAEHEEIYSSLASWYALVSYRFEKAKESCGAPEPDQAKPWASFFLTCAGLLNMERIQAACLDPLLMQIFPDKTKYMNLTTLIKTQHIQKDAYKSEEKFTMNLATLIKTIKTQHIQKDAYKLEEKFTWNDSVKALQKAGIELPKKLTKK